MLNIQIIEKKYNNQTVLKNIDFTISKPGMYGLVGKNGHGKTTFFKCILNLESYSGNCKLNDTEIQLCNVAWIPTKSPLYDELTAAEFYNFYTNLLDLKKTDTAMLFDVAKDKLIKHFSTGMKKKTYLNAAFQREYPVYFLDEPFNGLDLEANHILMQYLIQKSKQSIVLISSHILEILYQNCSEIFALNNQSVTLFDKDNFNQIQETLFGS